MVLDKLSRLGNYEGICAGALKAADFLKTVDIKNFETGKVVLDGEDLFASLQQYEITEDNKKWEYHKKYIDIQCILEGEEVIYWSSTDEITDWTEFDEEKDCAISSKDGKDYPILLKAGDFAIFDPSDAHKPKCLRAESVSVKKIVFKVKVK